MMRLGSLLCGLAYLTTSVTASEDHEEYTLQDFNTKIFWKRPHQGYYPVNVGLPAEGARIMAISDLNNDKYQDLVTINPEGTQLTVNYFSDDSLTYKSFSNIELPEGLYADNVIVMKAPQALQSLLVVASNESGPLYSDKTTLLVYDQAELSTSGTIKYSWTASDSDLSNLQISEGSQPMILDINGDQLMDVLYQSTDSGIKVALGTSDPKKFETVDFFDNFVLSSKDDANCKDPNQDDQISLPNSNAFLDLNGDCVADLFLTRQTGSAEDMKDTTKQVNSYYEIYSQQFVKNAKGDYESKYCLASQDGTIINDKNTKTNLSKPMPLIEFADFNRDSLFDLIFMTEEGKLIVLYNELTAMGPKAESLCRDMGNTADLKNKQFFEAYPFTAMHDILEGQLQSWSDTIVFKGLTPSLRRSNPPSIPGRPRVIDLDMNSFPDIILTLDFYDTTDDTTTSRTMILMNHAAEGEDFATHNRALYRMTKKNDSSNPLYKIITEAGESGELVTAIDIDEDGSLDIIIQKQDETLKTPQLVMLYNSIVTDGFFMKALMVNSEQFKSQNIYTDNTVGASYRFVITDTTDVKLVIAGTQSYQQGYMSLKLPYAFLGIGRSNNYIETFTASTTAHGKRANRMWTPIIPNSQLIVFAQTSNAASVDSWGLELFISPTASLYLIVLVSAICLLVIGVAIVMLHCREKQEDDKKREQHFDFF